MPRILTLDNNARLIQRNTSHSEIVHCGLLINAGSRDEDVKNNGIAHFIEHTVFKGTERRKSHHILTFIEKVGGELNAYTTREKTCYYVSCLKQYADKAVDILCDIAFSATFPEDEIQKEKKVIAEEIEMYDDSPDESIYDSFYTHLFGEHALGFNILGTRKSVKGLSKAKIKTFREQFYAPENIVLSLAGEIGEKKAESLANKYLAGLKPSKKVIERKAPLEYQKFDLSEKKDFTQYHCMLGGQAYSKHDPRRFGLALVNNILGGPGMSSRLNMVVREKYGLTYQVGSNYSSYQDAGVFSVYFATDKKNIGRCRELVNKELDKLCREKLSPRQLQQAKVQMMGQIALVDENQNVHMQSQAKSLLDYGQYYSFKDFLKKVDEVSADDILEICNEIMEPSKLNTLIYESE
jgi:predicted Zn-dependent peptidase